MCKEVNRLLTGAAVCLSVMAITACGNGNAEEVKAESMLACADSAYSAENYQEAIDLIDTLAKAYPRQTDVQRRAMALRPQIVEALTIDQIEENDKERAYTDYRRDSLMKYFVRVHRPELGSDYDYYVIKEMERSNLFSRTGVEGRVDPDGQLIVMSSLISSPVKHTSISLTGSAGEVRSAEVAYDGERNYRSSGTEMITFMDAECDTLGQWLSETAGNNPVKLVFNGTRAYSVSLSSNDRKSVKSAWELSHAVRNLRKLKVERDMLERKLQLARDQAARTHRDED